MPTAKKNVPEKVELHHFQFVIRYLRTQIETNDLLLANFNAGHKISVTSEAI